jgi:hypothetical protein
MKKIFLLLFVANFSYSQDFKTVPDVFNQQCKASFINEIENGSISLDNLKATKTERYWIVYSDRDDNQFYFKHHDNLKSKYQGSFMQGFYVKNTNGNWLHLVDFTEEIDYGWIQAKYLLLSLYSLKTEGDIEKGEVSIPRKAVILTSIDEAKNVGGMMQTQKRYYTNRLYGFNEFIFWLYLAIKLFRESLFSLYLFTTLLRESNNSV